VGYHGGREGWEKNGKNNVFLKPIFEDIDDQS
jgi:hypothetical protein